MGLEALTRTAERVLSRFGYVPKHQKLRNLASDVNVFIRHGAETIELKGGWTTLSTSDSYERTLQEIYDRYQKKGLSEDEIFDVAEKQARRYHQELIRGESYGHEFLAFIYPEEHATANREIAERIHLVYGLRKQVSNAREN